MNLDSQLTIPNDWQATRSKVEAIITNSDLVIEVVDARIITSSSNLFDYRGAVLSHVPQIIYLSFEDRANEQVSNQWRKYYTAHDIFVIPKRYFEKKSITELWSMLIKIGIVAIPLLNVEQNIRVILVGTNKVGKKTLIRKLTNAVATSVPKAGGLYAKIVKKSITYHNIVAGIDVVDTIAVLPPRIADDNLTGLYLQLLNKAQILKTETIVLATQAFQVLFSSNNKILDKYYGIHIPPAQFKKGLSLEEIGGYFEKIAVNRDLLNEFGNIDAQQACDLICKEFGSDVYNNFSLEIPPQ